MSDLPVPDLLDSAGRVRRIVFALLVGCAAAVITYTLCDQLATPAELPGGTDGGHRARAFGFVFYMTGFAGFGCAVIALAIQTVLANRRARAEQFPVARIR